MKLFIPKGTFIALDVPPGDLRTIRDWTTENYKLHSDNVFVVTCKNGIKFFVHSSNCKEI